MNTDEKTKIVIRTLETLLKERDSHLAISDINELDIDDMYIQSLGYTETHLDRA